MLTVDDIRAAIKRSCQQIDVDALVESTDLREQDIDSLDMFNIMLELEAITGTSIPDEDFERLQSIEAIEQYFASRS